MKTVPTGNGRLGLLSRSRAWSGIWVAAAVGVVLLFVASAAASPVTAMPKSFSERAPYAGTPGADIFGLLSGTGGPICGVTEKFPVSPFFNLTTGHADLSVIATSRSCGPGTSFSGPEEAAGFATANFTTTTGMHDIKATWVFDFSVRLKAMVGGPSQSALAYVLITTQLYLWDETNFTVVNQNNSPYLLYSNSSGTFDHTFHKISQALFLNASLVKGHVYSLTTYVYLDAYASVSPGDSSAYASGNMGSDGRSAYLSSLTGL